MHFRRLKYLVLLFSLGAGFFSCATPLETKEDIDLSIQKRGQDFSACFDKWTPAEHSVRESKLIVSFYIENDGSVTREKIKESEVKSPSVERCVLQVMKTIRFQKNTNPYGISVDYPFTVTPSGTLPNRRSDQIL